MSYGCPWENQGYPDPTDYSDSDSSQTEENTIMRPSLIEEKRQAAKRYGYTPSTEDFQASVWIANAVSLTLLFFVWPALAIVGIMKNNIFEFLVLSAAAWISIFLLFYLPNLLVDIVSRYIKK